MKKMSHWGKPVALFAIALSTVGGLLSPATAVSNTTTTKIIQNSESTSSFQRQDNIQLAQGGLVGQCRATKVRIFVYTQRATSSQTLRTLAPNEQVTLADNGNAGWIAISAPVTGYVQAKDLKPCQGNNQPPDQTANFCRVVLATDGLSVRQGPSPTSGRVGGVALQQTVRLSNPQQSQADSTGRTWVKIVAPTTGWVSSGFPNGNLSLPTPCR